MSTDLLLKSLRKPCGRTTGHGESCSVGWLCSACGEKAKAADRIERMESELAELRRTAPTEASAQPSDQQKHVAPPMRGTGSQHDAGASELADEEILSAVGHIDPLHYGLPASGPDYEGYDLACARLVESLVASRCRAQGGNTCDKSSCAAPAEQASESVDTPEFRDLLWKFERQSWSVTAIENLIAHINAWGRRASTGATVRAGWQWVPKEPTNAMIQAAACTSGDDWASSGRGPEGHNYRQYIARKEYAAMLAAAPSADNGEGQE